MNDQPKFRSVIGQNLRVGDTIKVWWKPGRDMIAVLDDYSGPLQDLFPQGAKIAGFAVGPGMTIDLADQYQRMKF